MATFIVKYTVTQQRVAILEATDAENAKLVDSDAGHEVGNAIQTEYMESTAIVAKQIDQIEYQDI